MSQLFKKKITYVVTALLASVGIIVYGWMNTRTENYSYETEGVNVELLQKALTSIFIYKASFGLVLMNALIFGISKLVDKKYIQAIIALSLLILFFFGVRKPIDTLCARHYYTVFQNQMAAESFLKTPILDAGPAIGPILTEQIENRELPRRRYAIAGLADLKYLPATSVLQKILFDKTEESYFRADAYEALSVFNTQESRQILTDFKNQASDSIDFQVIHEGEAYLENP